MGLVATLLCSLLLTITFITTSTNTVPFALAAKSDGPRITKTRFENTPTNLFYFDDSDVVLVQDRDEANVWRSDDAGETWKIVDDNGQKGQVWDVWPHPFDNKKAYMLGVQHIHWVTEDRGLTWRKFETEATPTLFRAPFAFHGRDSDKVIFHGQVCQGWECSEHAFVTDDGFRTMIKLKEDIRGCAWAVGTPLFGQDIPGFKGMDNRIFCISRGLYSPWPKDNRLLVSDDYFDEHEVEPFLESGRAVNGIVSTASAKKFFVAAARAEGTDELALYVTDDSVTWHRAEFGNHKLEEDAYTLLESTNYSLQIDVMTTKPTSAMGVLFTSNSNGTYFTRNVEHTNRNINGLVDFEKIQGIQGIVLVNVVDNWQEVEKSNLKSKKVKSKISFDDGRTFQALKVGDKELHLHSVTDMTNVGRIFSSPAPGIVLGIGNTGEYLKEYENGDLFVSDDAGVTWRKGLEEAHKYEIGDQGAVIMAINDEKPVDKISYSINHGKDWDKADLGIEVRARILTTTPDSTSLKFLMIGSVGGGSNAEQYIFSIDFSGLHERKCGKDDFERWPARLNEKGEPDCLMGHKQFYRRRKSDADCFVDEEFKDPEPEFVPCKCTAEDFECDFNFVKDDKGTCIPSGPIPVPEGACLKEGDTFMGSSGLRLIPGDACDRVGGVDLDKKVERPCTDSVKVPASGEITVEKTYFEARAFSEAYYMERTETSTGDDETIIMRTSEQEIYITKDHGKTWKQILTDKDITSIWPHQYFNDVVFFLTGTETVYYSIDRGEIFHEFEAPAPPNRDHLRPIAFHPDYKDWLLWAGAADCDGFGSCHTVAHVTTDRGDNWNTLLRYVRKCEFIKKEGRGASEKLVYCEQFEKEDPANNLQLVSSDNWFSDSVTHFNNIVDFATMSEFIIVAAKSSDQKSLKVGASVDGKTFADAEFPPNFNVPVQQAYTVLDSSTHSVFLHVTVNNQEEHEFGSIIKSNSNGTSYVMSLNGVNRDTVGYVDFEKMQGLEGVALVNVVSNAKEVANGQRKKLKTMITHNDGAEWALIGPPAKDAEGHDYGCQGKNGKATDSCSLHLHGYTERKDPQDTFSSPTAVGIMMGTGNVGDELGLKANADTFITRDGGITWHTVKKGNYMWEFGDQGSIIVIIEEHNPTTVLYYSLDEGETWIEYVFSDVEMQIDDLSTVPSDSSRQFLLWGRETSKGGKPGIATVNVDFSGLKERERQCELSEDSPDKGDYILWEPKHPLQEDNCLFGHVAQYHRKRPEAECFNGRKIQHLHNIARNCSCTRQDFEW